MGRYNFNQRTRDGYEISPEQAARWLERNDNNRNVNVAKVKKMPLTLYKKVKDVIPDGIGVLIYYDGESTCGIRKKVECKPRQLSEETQKWLIMSVAKRLTKINKA